MDEDGKYCPVCGRIIIPEEVNDGLLYVHDDIVHTEEDVAALDHGIQ